MKLSDYNQVKLLVSQLEYLEVAKGQTVTYLADYADEHSFYLHNQRDGSGAGRGANLSGCDVSAEVLEATIQILRNKILSVMKELNELGVTA